MDGTDAELLGDEGRLRTKICWSDPPYASFTCPAEFDGQRLDGPVSFFWQGRLFVVARKHLQGTGKKRTSLFEVLGDFVHGGALTIQEWGELPSGGDTSYAGVAMADATHAVVSWYSGDLQADRPWVLGMLESDEHLAGNHRFLAVVAGAGAALLEAGARRRRKCCMTCANRWITFPPVMGTGHRISSAPRIPGRVGRRRLRRWSHLVAWIVAARRRYGRGSSPRRRRRASGRSRAAGHHHGRGRARGGRRG